MTAGQTEPAEPEGQAGQAGPAGQAILMGTPANAGSIPMTAMAAQSTANGWAPALRALATAPGKIAPLPFHAASEWVVAVGSSLEVAARGPALAGGTNPATGQTPFALAGGTAAATESAPRAGRILELLDRAGDTSWWAQLPAAVHGTAVTICDRATWLGPPAGVQVDKRTGQAIENVFDLVYVHPQVDSRAEWRRLLARIDRVLAPGGAVWVQAIDPVFAPMQLPPAGRVLVSLSALVTDLRAAGWRAAVRSPRAVYAPELLLTRARTDDSVAAGAVVAVRDGLGAPRQMRDGRWARPVLEPARPQVVVTVLAPEPPSATAAARLRLTVDVNTDAGDLCSQVLGSVAVPVAAVTPPAVAALGPALVGRTNQESDQAKPTVAELDSQPGRRVEEWVLPAGAGVVVHWRLAGAGLRDVYNLQVEWLPAEADRGWSPATLPVEMRKRHQAVADRLRAGAAGGAAGDSIQTVLDVGGAPGLLAALLPELAVTVVDTAHAAELPGFLRMAAVASELGGEFALPFGDGEFDAVVALDVLEHIPAAARERFVRECGRCARRQLLIACPVDSAAARAAEAALAAALPEAHAFLEEHARFGLPAAATVRSYFAAAGWAVTAEVAGATVAQWLADTAGDLGVTQVAPSADGQTVYRRIFEWEQGRKNE